ncbi:transposase [Novosphingobium sp. SG751A]|nr:transposase [Novosphingobium sp. SG751A]
MDHGSVEAILLGRRPAIGIEGVCDSLRGSSLASELGNPGKQLGGKKGDLGRLIGRTKGGMNTKLHAVTDANGRPLSFFITAGQISDYTGAAALLDELPKAQWMLADRGYDAEWFRDALEQKGIEPCIPGRKSRSLPVKYDKRRYNQRNRIEKAWRRNL